MLGLLIVLPIGSHRQGPSWSPWLFPVFVDRISHQIQIHYALVQDSLAHLKSLDWVIPGVCMYLDLILRSAEHFELLLRAVYSCIEMIHQ